MMYSKKIDKGSVSRLAEILSKLNPVEIVTPVNAKSAKETWINCASGDLSVFSNPTFEYSNNVLKEIVAYHDELVRYRSVFNYGLIPDLPGEDAMKAILIARIDSAIAATELAASIYIKDDKASASIAKKLYGLPTSTEIIEAYDAVSPNTPKTPKSRFSEEEQEKLKTKKFNAQQIKYWFERTIKLYGFKGWRVEIDKKYTCIDVRDKNLSGSPVVGIPVDRKVDGLKLLELIGHEIESHLRSSENSIVLIQSILGVDSPLAPLFRIMAKSDDETLYEGAAKVSDVKVNGASALPLPYATIACNHAKRGENFAEVAKIIFTQRKKAGEDDKKALSGAWTTAYRIFRGSTNTEAGIYLFPKDYIYRKGYKLACAIEEKEYLDYSTFTISELQEIFESWPYHDEKSCCYPSLDAVGIIANEILSGK